MAAPAFAFEGEAAPVEQPILPEVVEDVVTVTDETSGALTPEGNLTLVDDYHTSYSDGSGQQFITLVSKSGNTFYLVIDRNAKGQQTVHRQGSQVVEVCHGEVLEAKLRGTEAEGEKSQPQVGGVYTRVDIERRG